MLKPLSCLKSLLRPSVTCNGATVSGGSSVHRLKTFKLSISKYLILTWKGFLITWTNNRCGHALFTCRAVYYRGYYKFFECSKRNTDARIGCYAYWNTLFAVLFLLGSTGFLEVHQSCKSLSPMMLATRCACHITGGRLLPLTLQPAFLMKGCRV